MLASLDSGYICALSPPLRLGQDLLVDEEVPVGRAMTSARWLWARREIARRWRSLVAVGLLAGIAGGLSLAAISGARRSQTAYSRYRVATAAPDAVVFGTQVGAEDVD